MYIMYATRRKLWNLYQPPTGRLAKSRNSPAELFTAELRRIYLHARCGEKNSIAYLFTEAPKAISPSIAFSHDERNAR